MRTPPITFAGVAAALTVFCAVAGRAAPPFPPLLRPAPLAMILSPQENALIASALPAKASSPALTLGLRLPQWPAGGESLWSRDADPSLRLADWRRVFDVAALGSFDVPLRDDPAERTNILLSAQAVDGVVVPPGGEFSFNDQVGERTPERGFQDGLMFESGKVVRGTGGGICLVATGLYNAALQAGLEITERHPHSGVVSYAPPGCDAGIVYGQEDFKFRNTTPRPLVIRAEPADDAVTIQLFGQTPPPGRSVVVKPTSLDFIPYAVETKPDPTLPLGTSVVDQKPRSGYHVVVTRFWLQGRRVVRREVVASETRAPRNEIKRVAIPPVAPPPAVLPSVPGSTDPLLPGQAGPDGLGVPAVPDAGLTVPTVLPTD